MRAISKKKCLTYGELGLQNLFEFVCKNAESMQAYEMEQNIFRLAMKIAFSAMEYYFAEKGTGDIGPELNPTMPFSWTSYMVFCFLAVTNGRALIPCLNPLQDGQNFLFIKLPDRQHNLQKHSQLGQCNSGRFFSPI